jgi:dipeptidyl aminopeptidase
MFFSTCFLTSNFTGKNYSPFAQPIRITDSGNGTLFHGVPDWVYEEEVFASDNTLWWSPDSTKIAFLRLDETAVAEYKFPIYNPTENSSAVWPYTHDVIMKYPKPGYDNPLVSLHIFDLDRYLAHHAGTALTAVDTIIELDWDGRHLPTNRIIQEVAWVGNTTLIVKEVNRNADDGSVVLFDLSIEDLARRPVGRIVRRLGSKGEEGDDGWIDNVRCFLRACTASHET